MERELEYKDMTARQKEGLEKFSRLSSDHMVQAFALFEAETGLRATNINNKAVFYDWMASIELTEGEDCEH
jgi:hypothetical protein